MTTRPRSAVEVHRPRSDASTRPAEAAPKLRFSDLLKSRRAPTPPAEPLRAAFASELETDNVEADVLAEESTTPDERDNPAPLPSPPALAQALIDTPTPDPGMSEEWLESLIPKPEELEEMLAGGRRVARAQAVKAAAMAHPSVASIAQTISRFCNDPAVADSEGWQVSMPMRKDVLPETVLQLSVSPYWLQLRFETTDVSSRDLLFANRDSLNLLLEDSLNRRRDIAIVID